MRTDSQPFLLRHALRTGLAALCAVLLLPGDVSLWARSPAPGAAQDKESKIPPDQLDSLVAPIALYPDPLLAQVLAASTYPLEIIQLQQWLTAHPGLKDKALADAVAKQDWDPSVQGLAGLPDVVKRLADDIKWATDLGNAFLSQQSDVMDAVQRMRAKAKDKGNLKSNEQMKVETKTVESQQVIVIEQANPQVIYVPSYEPTVVYGAPAYPYPPIAYPPPGYYAAGMALSFGVGIAMGAMWSGGWGNNCRWGGGGNNNININNNNNFNRNSNVSGGNRNNVGGGNRGGAGGGGNWQHNPSHRGGTPYSNKGTADKFGGTTRGSSQGARQSSARQQVGREQASGNFGGATGGRGGGSGAGGRGGAASAGTMDRGAGGRGGGAGGNRAGAGGGADRVGNRSTSGSKGSNSNAFGGGGRNSSGGAARASSSRGSSSMGGSRGGGGGRRR